MVDLKTHAAFLDGVLDRQKRRRLAIDPTFDFPPAPILHNRPRGAAPTGSAEQVQSKENVVNYLADEETIRNDYTAWYTSSGVPGSDYILGAMDENICEEYPALRRLMDLKKQLNDTHTHPPLHIQLLEWSPSATSDIVSALAPCRFDVILITPTGTWEETAALPMRNISADPSFVFLWVGRGDQEGLEKGRECLAKWGFRRAEDIVWVKTTNASRANGAMGDDDRTAPSGASSLSEAAVGRGVGRDGLLASQKEHCLMGIRGTVRRSTDTRFVHCNVDTDVMLWEDLGGGSQSQSFSYVRQLIADTDGPRFPPYLYTLIESFCLGTRRLHLSPSSSDHASPPPAAPRRGWVTASPYPAPPGTLAFDPAMYPMMLPPKQDGRDVLPFDPEIDNLRPKSPTRNNKRGGNNLPHSSQSRPNNARFDSRDSFVPARGSPPVRGNWQAPASRGRPPSAPRMSAPPGSYQHQRPNMGYSGYPNPPAGHIDSRSAHHAYGAGYAQDHEQQMAYLAAQMQQVQMGGYIHSQQQMGGYGEGFAGQMAGQQQFAWQAGGQGDPGAGYGYARGYGQEQHGGQGQYYQR